MTLSASMRITRGAFTATFDLDAPAGEPLAILGPNGSGKTSALHALAGLARIDAGHIAVGDRMWDQPAAGIFRPPEARRAGLVFQDHRLFPHASALDNVAFGIRATGTRPAEARTLAAGWLEYVGLDAHAASKPGQLSRGQASLVALARALAPGPRVLLLDEPFAALDATTKSAIRNAVRTHVQTYPVPVVIVTHDPLDAFAIAQRIAVVEDGRVVQHGTPDDIRLRPASRFVADLAGINRFPGIAAAGGLQFEQTFLAAVHDLPSSTPAIAVIHPRAVSLHPAPPAGSARNIFAGTVADVTPSGEVLRVTLAGAVPIVAEVTHAGAASIALQPGASVYAVVKATEVAVYPA